MRTNKNSNIDNIDAGLKKILEDVEKKKNYNLYYTSILRSKEENKKVGGWEYSQHIDFDDDGDSQAVDIARSSFEGSPESLAKLLYSLGATGIGIYNTHVHVDNNPDRVVNPYFRDYRTNFNKFDEVKNKINSFDYFKSFYNKKLAVERRGSTQNKVKNFGFSDDTLIKVGIAVVSILITLDILDS